MVLRHPQGELTLAVSERVFAAADIEFENATEFLGANEQVEVLSLRTCPETYPVPAFQTTGFRPVDD
jgi:hypothetical protein